MTQPLQTMPLAKKHRIVIVEDHVLVREGMVALLNGEPDFQVVAEVTDALEAINVINELRPDIVLTDIGMPNSPFEMVRSCLKVNPSLKVIFITAFSTDLNLERALMIGAKGFVSKGTQSRVLCEAIRQVVNGSEYFSDDIRDRVNDIKNNRRGDAASGTATRHRLLSPREFEVLRCVAKGMSAKAIAQELHISVKTVDRHKSNIMAKLSIHNQVDLTRYAIREGLITP